MRPTDVRCRRGRLLGGQKGGELLPLPPSLRCSPGSPARGRCLTRACSATCSGPTRRRILRGGRRTTAASPSRLAPTSSRSSCRSTTSTSSCARTRCGRRRRGGMRRGGMRRELLQRGVAAAGRAVAGGGDLAELFPPTGLAVRLSRTGTSSLPTGSWSQSSRRQTTAASLTTLAPSCR